MAPTNESEDDHPRLRLDPRFREDDMGLDQRTLKCANKKSRLVAGFFYVYALMTTSSAA